MDVLSIQEERKGSTIETEIRKRARGDQGAGRLLEDVSKFKYSRWDTYRQDYWCSRARLDRVYLAITGSLFAFPFKFSEETSAKARQLADRRRM